MGRYVHMELWAALAVLTGTAGGVAVAVGVRDEPPVRADTVKWVVALAVVYLVAATLLRASRLKWVGEVRDFEAAGPVPGAGPTPRHLSYGLRMLGLVATSALFASFFTDTAVAVALALALDWLVKAAVGARWERAHGRVLWRGHDRGEPWRLSYSPVTAPPSTRTATDGPPA